MNAWRSRSTGQWLTVDQTRTHVKTQDSYRMVDDIHQAYVGRIPNRVMSAYNLIPVLVTVTRAVKIMD